MRDRQIKIGISGAGGYGYYYIKEMLDNERDKNVQLCAVFDPNIRHLPIYQQLIDRKISCHSAYADFLESLTACDLMVIVSPIHYHEEQTIDALNIGCNVLIDKPLAGSKEQSRQIIQAVENSSAWAMVGYQWSYSEAIRQLKSDLLSGRFGKIFRAKTLVFWPRGYDYFARNDWAGKIKSADGRMINDSLVNNAMAHFIHNLLFLAGEDMSSAAQPVSGMCELYRAYQIETFDTAMIRWTTTSGAEMFFYGSHVTRNSKGPLFILECEKATIYFGELRNEITAVGTTGRTHVYGNPDSTNQFEKLWLAVERCRNGDVPDCSVLCASEQTKLIDAIAGSAEVLPFPAEHVIDLKDDRRYVDGLGYMLLSSYQQGVMPSDQSFIIQGIQKSFKV